MLTIEQIRAYLARIGVVEVACADDKTLAALQYAHLQTVPYENLDILAGKAISLELGDIFEKIVTHHRGGFCFELNRLFGELLRGLGYEVTDYVARYWRGETSIPLRRHQVLRVKTCENHEFLCDVGVGAVIPLWPVPYVVGEVCDQNGICYALREDPTFGKVLTELHEGAWRDVYSFNEDVQLPCDFTYPCFWCEHAPDSPFRAGYMLAIRKGADRHTFDGPVYKIFSGDEVIARETDEAGRKAILAEVFGLAIE
ncbi:MAG: arylamine N-acetyltransferase [Ruminococcaceae bacterium]|nr:arylamine N-acetyltransferase [Oscillospiraceae bacterium]